MGKIIELLSLIRSHKDKVFILLVSPLFFLFFLFPFDDLSDLVTSQVSALTNNSFYVQFDKLKMSLLPQPGVKMDQVFVQTPGTPPISISELLVSPSISGIIQQKPFGKILAKGLLQGDIKIQLGKGKTTENGIERQQIEISANDISLTELRDLARVPMLLKGKLNLEGSILADPSFQEQPDLNLNLAIEKFELPPSNVNTPMGDLTLPDLKLSSITLKGRLSAGRFIIETGSLGKPTDDLFGTIKGNIDFNFHNRDGSFTQKMGGYDLEIDLTAKRSFQDRAALFLGFIDNYKTPIGDGAQYKFKMTATGPGMPPSFGSSR